MQKGKIILLILVALLMAFGASIIANKMMSKQLNAETGLGDTVNTIVATTDIAYGQILQQENLALKKIPKQLVTADAFTSFEKVIGKVAKGEIFEGETIVSKRLANPDEGTILAALVNKNMRAVSVRVDDVIGVAGFLLPGNRVDVLASRMDKRRSITRTILQNIKVLAVDQTAETSKDVPLLVRAVTLEVSPDDSEALFQAIQEGSIHLTLRNPIDFPIETVAKTELIKSAVTTVKKKKTKPRRKKRRSKNRDLALEALAKRLLDNSLAGSSSEVKQSQPVNLSVQRSTKPAKKRTSTVTVIRGLTQKQVTLQNNEAIQ